MDPLTFAELRTVNVERCNSRVFGITLDSRTPTDFACALAGEVGEACNLIYKRSKGMDISVESIAKELADAQTYLDLLAARLNIDLGAATRSKFNAVSDRVGSPVKLPAAPPQGAAPCPTCGGTGEEPGSKRVVNGHSVATACPSCHGTGQTP